jgi:hypothetical protein
MSFKTTMPSQLLATAVFAFFTGGSLFLNGCARPIRAEFAQYTNVGEPTVAYRILLSSSGVARLDFFHHGDSQNYTVLLPVPSAEVKFLVQSIKSLDQSSIASLVNEASRTSTSDYESIQWWGLDSHRHKLTFGAVESSISNVLNGSVLDFKAIAMYELVRAIDHAQQGDQRAAEGDKPSAIRYYQSAIVKFDGWLQQQSTRYPTMGGRSLLVPINVNGTIYHFDETAARLMPDKLSKEVGGNQDAIMECSLRTWTTLTGSIDVQREGNVTLITFPNDREWQLLPFYFNKVSGTINESAKNEILKLHWETTPLNLKSVSASPTH